MSFNLNLEETTKLLEKAAKRKMAEEENKKIKENTVVLTEEQQKEVEMQASDWSKFNAKETEEELSKHAYKLSEKEIEEVNSKVENIMPYINEDIDD